jgi:iron complex outermembrane receptor protein
MATVQGNFKLIKSQNWNPLELSLIGQYYFKQSRWNITQEILPPPNGYLLLSGSISEEFKLFKNFHKISITVENILNQSYRNYLNRQRFFANETGRNIVFKVDFRF